MLMYFAHGWRALPRRIGLATLFLLVAYGIVTALGILLTILLAAIYHPIVSAQVPMLQIPAYAMSIPYHPVLNLLVWPAFGWLYLRHSTSGPEALREAIRLGAFWVLATAVGDVVGWVLIRHPWHLTLNQFYIGYQPWITLIYLVIFISPILAAQSARIGAIARVRSWSRSRIDRYLVGLLVLLGVSAVGAGVLMVIAPDGRLVGMKVASLALTPFADYLIPGLALTIVIGLGSTWAAIAAARHSALAPQLALALGLSLMVLEVIELASIPFSPLQPLMFAAGFAVATWGWRKVDRSIPCSHA